MTCLSIARPARRRVACQLHGAHLFSQTQIAQDQAVPRFFFPWSGALYLLETANCAGKVVPLERLLRLLQDTVIRIGTRLTGPVRSLICRRLQNPGPTSIGKPAQNNHHAGQNSPRHPAASSPNSESRPHRLDGNDTTLSFPPCLPSLPRTSAMLRMACLLYCLRSRDSKAD